MNEGTEYREPIQSDAVRQHYSDQLDKDLISLRQDLEVKIKLLSQAVPHISLYSGILSAAEALKNSIVANIETKSNLVDNSFNRQMRAHER